MVAAHKIVSLERKKRVLMATTTTTTDRRYGKRTASKCSQQKQNKSVDSTSQIVSHKVQITIFICFCVCVMRNNRENMRKEWNAKGNPSLKCDYILILPYCSFYLPCILSQSYALFCAHFQWRKNEEKYKKLFFMITFDRCTNHHH